MVDCIIIGGGIIGMLTARELAASGVDVLILEQGVMGGESSWAGGGILSPLYPWRYDDAVNALAKYSQGVYQAIAEDLLADSGVDPEYNQCGLMVLDRDDDVEVDKWALKWHMKLHKLNSYQDLADIEPGLGEKMIQASWLPDIAQMRNPRLVKAMAGSLQKKQIKFKEHCKVEKILHHQGMVTGVQTREQVIKADRVIIAGGAWSGELGGDSGISRPRIEPVKGQMILFKARPGVLNTMVLSHGRYLIPRRDGRILAGSTLEYTGFEKEITQDAMASLKASAIELLPALADYAIEHQWAGLRPGTETGIPYVCEYPDLKGLYINSGHYRNGVILGAASAKLMSDLVTGKPSLIDMTPYQFGQKH